MEQTSDRELQLIERRVALDERRMELEEKRQAADDVQTQVLVDMMRMLAKQNTPEV